jgi:predicted metal-dependent phosphoesterase TrpH
MKIDLHTHTKYSIDSKMEVEELIRTAEKNGLDAIAICDHDNMLAIDAAMKIKTKVMVIPGMEITCEKGTHLIGLFLHSEIVSKDIDSIIDEIHAQGGLAMLPHPLREGTGLLHNRYKDELLTGEETGRGLSKIDLIEAVNFRCSEEAILASDKYLKAYPDIPQVAGSDAHNIEEVGKAYILIEDFQTDNIDDMKVALLHSPYLLRFEVYNPEIGAETRQIIMPNFGRKFLWKTKRILNSPIKFSARNIFKKSSNKPIKKIEGPTKT